ncbi:MAG TPA: hypothetical protein VK717_13395 [Opitutaceae bacterium]|jgi:hypothetical protein|nr:hypothetical protein [Opitutaceae bacterium]
MKKPAVLPMAETEDKAQIHIKKTPGHEGRAINHPELGSTSGFGGRD